MIDVIEAWLRLAADAAPRPGAALTALDQAIGDGDHGINMDRGFSAIVATLDGGRPEGDGDARRGRRPILRTCRAGPSSARSAAPPGRSTARRSCGRRARSPRPTRPSAAAGVAGRRAGGGDRRHRSRSARRRPARRRCSTRSSRPSTAGREAAAMGADAAAVSLAMADAAEAGAAATIPMLATKGRASYLGERSHRPPGSGRDVVGAPRSDALARRRERLSRDATMAQRDPRRARRLARRRHRAAAARSDRRPDRERPRRRVPAADARRRARPPRRAPSSSAAAELDGARRPDCRSGPARRSARSSRRRRCSRATRGSSIPRWPLIDDGRRRGRGDPARDGRAGRAARGRRRRVLPRAGRGRARRRPAGRRAPAGRVTGPTCGTATAIRPSSLADDLDPSAVATLRPELVAGIALAGGAPTGHAAIVARALGIPLVLGLGRAIDDLVGGTDGAVDGSTGRLLIVAERRRARRARGRRRARSPPVVATVGDRPLAVAVVANVGSAHEAEAAALGRCRRHRPRPDGAAVPRPPSPPRSPSSGRPIAGSAPPCPAGPSSSGRSTSAATSRPPGSPASEANPALGVRGIRLGLRRTGPARRPAPRPSRGGGRRRAAGHAADGRDARGARPGARAARASCGPIWSRADGPSRHGSPWGS